MTTTEERKEYRKSVRKKGIAARDGLKSEERIAMSEKLVSNIVASPEYKNAETIMIYKAFRGEARLESLEEAAQRDGKRLVYPLCGENYSMTGLHPWSKESWISGAYGITEPVPELSDEIMPEDIDLMICPCTVFDEKLNRMGMGAGYYDRFLPKCVNATIAAVALDVQKAEEVPTDEWDKPMDVVFTDAAVYRNK